MAKALESNRQRKCLSFGAVFNFHIAILNFNMEIENSSELKYFFWRSTLYLGGISLIYNYVV